MPTLILGTSSPIRQQLFARLKLPFLTVNPDIDETPLPNETASQLVERLARAKVDKIRLQHPTSVILCCDQVITVGKIILGKPLTHENAIKQLQLCSNKSVLSLTALAVFDPRRQITLLEVAPYTVYFRELNLAQIEAYLLQDQPYFCAGSIQAESLGPCLFRKMAGDDPTALLGLPLIKTIELLEASGVSILIKNQ